MDLLRILWAVLEARRVPGTCCGVVRSFMGFHLNSKNRFDSEKVQTEDAPIPGTPPGRYRADTVLMYLLKLTGTRNATGPIPGRYCSNVPVKVNRYQELMLEMWNLCDHFTENVSFSPILRPF